jgi:hypothetical protein
VLKIARTKSQQIFYCALAVEALYPRVAIVPTIRTFFSLWAPKKSIEFEVVVLFGGKMGCLEDIIGSSDDDALDA